MRDLKSGFSKVSSDFLKDDNGVAAIEYALIAAATGLALASTLPSLQSNMADTWNGIKDYFA